MTTRWLSAAEQRAWRSYLSATSLLEDAIDRRLQAEAGMPPSRVQESGGDLDLDVRGLRLLTQRQPDRQDAGVVRSGHFARVGRRR